MKTAIGRARNLACLARRPALPAWAVLGIVLAAGGHAGRPAFAAGTGQEPPPRPSTTRAPPATGPASRPGPTVAGDIRVHSDLAAPQLGNTRSLFVWLPPGYDQHPDQRYPVLYLHDGQNVFDVATSSGGREWQADETATRLIRSGELPPIIIVAITNTPDRIDEYTPFRDPRHGGGRGDAYINFVIDTVKPLIDRTYRTRPAAGDTAIAGSSLGGLISLRAAWRRPDVFGAAAALSPSLFWADRAMLRYMAEHPASPKPRLWIDIGTAEGRSARAREGGDRMSVTPLMADCRALVQVLLQQGYRPGDNLHYEEVADANHHEGYWAARFDRVLRFLFAERAP